MVEVVVVSQPPDMSAQTIYRANGTIIGTNPGNGGGGGGGGGSVSRSCPSDTLSVTTSKTNTDCIVRCHIRPMWWQRLERPQVLFRWDLQGLQRVVQPVPVRRFLMGGSEFRGTWLRETWLREIVISFLYILYSQTHINQFGGAEQIAFISKPCQWPCYGLGLHLISYRVPCSFILLVPLFHISSTYCLLLSPSSPYKAGMPHRCP